MGKIKDTDQLHKLSHQVIFYQFLVLWKQYYASSKRIEFSGNVFSLIPRCLYLKKSFAVYNLLDWSFKIGVKCDPFVQIFPPS